MTAHGMTTVKALDALDAVLVLEEVEVDLYRGSSPETTSPRVFGGQVAAQALIAAQETVDGSLRPHSLHAYFLLPGDNEVPIVYQVDRVHEGRAFQRRRVTALQHGRPIFSLESSFTTLPVVAERQPAAPDAAAPEVLPEMVPDGGDAPGDYMAWSPFEVRMPSDASLDGTGAESFWFRLRGALPERPAGAEAVLTYASDLMLISAILPPGTTPAREMLTSLDHALWFHNEVPDAGWFLYERTCGASGARRGLAQGRIFSQDGTLIASVAQEGLIASWVQE